MQQGVHEVVGVGIVGVPAADVQVSLSRVLQLAVLVHRLVEGPHSESDLAKCLGELPEVGRELAEEDGVDAGRQLDRLPGDRRLDRAVRRAGGPRNGAGRRARRRVAEEARRDDAVGGDGEPSDARGGRTRRRRRARTRMRRSSTSREGAPSGVEGHVVGREARVFLVSGSEAGIVPERFGVGGEQVEGEREPPGEELAADLLGRDAEAEDDAVGARIPLPPVGRVALELEPPAGVEVRRSGRDRSRRPPPPRSHPRYRSPPGGSRSARTR